LLQASAIADSHRYFERKMQFEKLLSELYSKTGNEKKELEHYKKAIAVRILLLMKKSPVR